MHALAPHSISKIKICSPCYWLQRGLQIQQILRPTGSKVQIAHLSALQSKRYGSKVPSCEPAEGRLPWRSQDCQLKRQGFYSHCCSTDSGCVQTGERRSEMTPQNPLLLNLETCLQRGSVCGMQRKADKILVHM